MQLRDADGVPRLFEHTLEHAGRIGVIGEIGEDAAGIDGIVLLLRRDIRRLHRSHLACVGNDRARCFDQTLGVVRAADNHSLALHEVHIRARTAADLIDGLAGREVEQLDEPRVKV